MLKFPVKETSLFVTVAEPIATPAFINEGDVDVDRLKVPVSVYKPVVDWSSIILGLITVVGRPKFILFGPLPVNLNVGVPTPRKVSIFVNV